MSVSVIDPIFRALSQYLRKNNYELVPNGDGSVVFPILSHLLADPITETMYVSVSLKVSLDRHQRPVRALYLEVSLCQLNSGSADLWNLRLAALLNDRIMCKFAILPYESLNILIAANSTFVVNAEEAIEHFSRNFDQLTRIIQFYIAPVKQLIDSRSTVEEIDQMLLPLLTSS